MQFFIVKGLRIDHKGASNPTLAQFGWIIKFMSKTTNLSRRAVGGIGFFSLLDILGGQTESLIHCLLEKALKSLPKDKILLETVLMRLPPTQESEVWPKSNLSCSVGLIKKST